MRIRTTLSGLISVALLLPFALWGQSKKADGEFQYVGARACKACHLTPKSGAAFKKWEASAHAKAFETLGTPEAKKIAKEKGIEDPQKAQACLKCHDTAAGVDAAQLAKTFKAGEGVGCEVCHGPGSKYKSMKVMKELDAGKVKGETVGFMMGDEKLCVTCHNEESPTFKKFDFKTYHEKIAHPTPVAKK